MPRTLEIVGEKWALLAVREVFLGNRRFDEMVRRTGAPRDTLAARLRSLTGALSRLPDAVGLVKLDRRQSEAMSEEFIKVWEAARLPDDAGGFRVCGEVVT